MGVDLDRVGKVWVGLWQEQANMLASDQAIKLKASEQASKRASEQASE